MGYLPFTRPATVSHHKYFADSLALRKTDGKLIVRMHNVFLEHEYKCIITTSRDFGPRTRDGGGGGRVWGMFPRELGCL